jgi:hypothetical protein
VRKVVIPHRPTQIRARAYGSGGTRVPGPTAGTLANSPAAAYVSIERLYVAWPGEIQMAALAKLGYREIQIADRP